MLAKLWSLPSVCGFCPLLYYAAYKMRRKVKPPLYVAAVHNHALFILCLIDFKMTFLCAGLNSYHRFGKNSAEDYLAYQNIIGRFFAAKNKIGVGLILLNQPKLRHLSFQ